MDSHAQKVLDVLAALGWLVVVAVVAGVLGVAIYRRLRSDLNTEQQPLTFSLSALRRLRDEGQITEAEYRRARAKVIGESQGSLGADDEPSEAAVPSKWGDEPHSGDSDKTNN